MRTNAQVALDGAATTESIDLDERDVRALTQYLTVLEDVGRAAGAEDLYLVVSESGKEYLVDARTDACECPDHEYRDATCKHRRRVAFATGERDVPTWVSDDDVAGDLGEHVDATPRQAAADGGEIIVAGDDAEILDESPGYTEHVEPAKQGGERYVRCEGCGRELLVALGGKENLVHADGCPNGEGR